MAPKPGMMRTAELFTNQNIQMVRRTGLKLFMIMLLEQLR